MTRAFLIITFLFLTSGNAYAQSRSSMPGTPPLPARVVPEEAPEDNPGLTNIVGACTQPGDMLTIEGQRLNELDNYVPALKVDDKALPLKALNQTDTRFVTRLPQEEIEKGKIYKIVLANEAYLHNFKETGLKVRVCPGAGSLRRSVERQQEILIFAPLDQRSTILSELENRNIGVLRDHVLEALEGILIVVLGDDDLIEELREIFLEAEIDFNADLQASKGPRLYAKDKIKWPDNSGCLNEAAKIPIGLIDGAIDQSHPAFTGQSIVIENFLNSEQPDLDHGTAIASILVGNAPEQGFDGLLRGFKLYSAVALRRAPDDKQLASVEGTIRSLNWLMDRDVRLINVSLAGKKNRVLIKSIELSMAHGTLIFAAAGNRGSRAPPAYPAAIDGVFAITAVDAANRIYKAANQGEYIDFAAPGVDIWSANSGGGGSYKSGTSYAVPYALAIASLSLTSNISMSSEVLEKAMTIETIDLGISDKDSTYGVGLLHSPLSCR